MKRNNSLAALETIREIKPDTMIFEQKNVLPDGVCEDMITRFEAAKDEQHPGHIGQQTSVDDSIKRSTDIYLGNKTQWQDIDQHLFHSLARALKEFSQAFPYFSSGFKDIGYNLQRTQPGEHYHWHIDGGSHNFSQRQLVPIWYLNDVAGPGGETEFLLQDVQIRPERGKLILFPPFWTHEHRGVTLQKGIKYIATTWIVFA